MIIYYEVLFFINCFIHYVISKVTSRFFRIRLNYKKLFLSFIIICLNIFLFINYDFMEYFKFIIGYILSIITFGKKSFIIFIVYASVNIMLAGTTILFDLYNYRIIILSCIPIIIIYEILSYIKEEKAKNKYYFSIIFKLDKVYKINAYLDTGNDLVEPKTKIPVIIVNEKIKGGKKVKIPYKTINNEDYLEAIYCKDFYIKINHKYMKKEVFVVSKKTKYDGLLNILLF